MKIKITYFLILLFINIRLFAYEPYDLRVELEKNPIGIDVPKPRFSWKMKQKEGVFGQKQIAYRILVATDISKLVEGMADVWDSKKVLSDESVLVDCLPINLKPRTDYYWTVKLWNEKDEAGAYASGEYFSTGFFSQNEWRSLGAQWIESSVENYNNDNVDAWIKYATVAIKATIEDNTPYTSVNLLNGGRYDFNNKKKKATDEDIEEAIAFSNKKMKEIWPGCLLRKEFECNEVCRARLYICGLGYYRAYMNGEMVGDRALAPSHSALNYNVYYNVYDVTKLIKSKEKNCIGVELVNGRWNSSPGCYPDKYYERPVMIAVLEIVDKEGNVSTVVSDEKWQCGKHGIVKSNFWVGELFDDNLYPYGWNKAGYKAACWKKSRKAKVFPKGVMMRDPMPAEKITEYHNPVKVTEPMPNVYMYDFGKQIVGRARFVFKGLKKGQRIAIRYSEAKPFDSPTPVPYVLGYYPSFENNTQHKDMLLFKRRGSVASHSYLNYTGCDGKKKRLDDYEMAGQLLYTDMYVASGKAVEVFQPDFTYVGFRYLEILGLEDNDVIDDVQAFSLRTDPEFVGTFASDNVQLDEVLHCTQGSLMGNYHSNYQDNPGSERNMFIINEAFNLENSAYWFNMYPQLRKVMTNTLILNDAWDYYVAIADLRNLNWAKRKYYHLSSSPSYPQLAAGMIGFYNDRRIGNKFAEQLVGFITDITEKVYWEHDLYDGSGDHQAESTLYKYKTEKVSRGDENPLSVKGGNEVTYRPYFKAAWIMYSALLAESVLRDLGYSEQADIVRVKKDAFCDRIINETDLYDKQKGIWNSRAFTRMGTNILEMLGDLKLKRPDDVLLEETVKEIEELGYITTGVKMTYELLHVLSQRGYIDIVAKVLLREEYPGFRHIIKTTVNTIPEGWDLAHSFTQVEGLSAVGRWYYCDLVGIAPSLNEPAFKRFTLKPNVPDVIGKYDFTYDSPCGMIESHWDEENGKVRWKIRVPANSVAEIYIPTVEGLKETYGMKYIGRENGRQVYELLSGVYILEFGL